MYKKLQVYFGFLILLTIISLYLLSTLNLINPSPKRIAPNDEPEVINYIDLPSSMKDKYLSFEFNNGGEISDKTFYYTHRSTIIITGIYDSIYIGIIGGKTNVYYLETCVFKGELKSEPININDFNIFYGIVQGEGENGSYSWDNNNETCTMIISCIIPCTFRLVRTDGVMEADFRYNYAFLIVLLDTIISTVCLAFIYGNRS